MFYPPHSQGLPCLHSHPRWLWLRQPQRRLLAMPLHRRGRDCHLVVGSSAGRRDRGCGLVFYPQANDPLGKANRS